jgi:alginate O-acetyltransferase complex protein AlgI
MLFNSIEFLFFYLPVVLLVFLYLRRLGSCRLLMAWLVLVSLFFYAWWNPVYLLLLLFSAGVNYSIGLMLVSSSRSRAWLAAGVLFNLGLLAYFKYAGFFLENLNTAFELGWNVQHIILPLAISFYTFQQITYLVDTRKGLTEAHGFLEYCLFVSFFPQLIAGPIVHHSEMFAQFKLLAQRRDTSKDLAIGGSILVIGLFKKVVIADSFALLASPVFTLASAQGELSMIDALTGTFAYAFQLYFDFSGYSDMAIGLACLFGLRLPVNFFSPYRAQNISDFWRMWHATLSRFLRDYVYMPLGGFICSPRRQRFNLFMTMFVGGVWHGAGWTFVMYGICHGAYVVLHQLWRIRVSGPLDLLQSNAYKAAAQAFTFVVVVLTLVLFRSDSVQTAGNMYVHLFGLDGWAFSPQLLVQFERSNLFRIVEIMAPALSAVSLVCGLLVLALLACWVLPSTYQLFERYEVTISQPACGRQAVWDLRWNPDRRWAVFVACLALAACLNLSQVSEFLYFQF